MAPREVHLLVRVLGSSASLHGRKCRKERREIYVLTHKPFYRNFWFADSFPARSFLGRPPNGATIDHISLGAPHTLAWDCGIVKRFCPQCSQNLSIQIDEKSTFGSTILGICIRGDQHPVAIIHAVSAFRDL